jgi:8-oxo-dGTP pyrophosphatase MutT (NUDIX family)
MWSAHGSVSRKRLRSSENPDTVTTMTREISAGGVVLRDIAGVWHVALIEPRKEGLPPAKTPSKRVPAVLGLPKGLLDEGEKAEAAAIREVFEEIVAEKVTKLVDLKYVYVRSWGDGKRVFKIVSFYLMRYLSGEIDDVTAEMRIEVKRALWVPLADASKQMAYSGERGVVLQAKEHLETHGLCAKRVKAKASSRRRKPS